MTLTRLTLRNLVYHWRGNLAVLLGVWIGAAVLTGALLVGDSLRGSLRDRTLRQLAGVENVLIGGRFIRAEVADGLPGLVKPAIFVQGTVRTTPTSGDPVSLSKVVLLGVDNRFWKDMPAPIADDPEFWKTDKNTVVVSDSLAKSLGVQVGDRIEVSTQAIAAIPRSSLLGKRNVDETTTTFRRLTVSAILPTDHPANAFSIAPNTSTPQNLFFPLGTLQKQLDQPNRVNAMFASDSDTKTLQNAFASKLTLADWNLKVQIPSFRKAYVSVESGQLLLEPFVVNAVHDLSKKLDARHADTFVYLTNWIASGEQKIPYSIVAALDPFKEPPLGKFVPNITELKDDEIILVEWKDSPIKAKVGDPITLTFFDPEIEGKLVERDVKFKLAGTIPLDGVANDRDLTPEFPGITDQLHISDWDPPFPYDGKRIKPRDEKYWDDYRTTPKAYVNLATGQKLWGSRFGDVTSIRMVKDGTSLDDLRKSVADELLNHLSPESGGLTFDPIRDRLLSASKGGTDFGMLFVAFSFFLIAAALMLVGLLCRLNIDKRATELGILRASGYPDRTVRRMLLTEGFILSVIGSALGLIVAVWYADQLLKLFVWLWPSQDASRILSLHVTPMSLGIGFFGTVIMALGTIWWAARILSKVEPRGLIEGETTPTPDVTKPLHGRKWSIVTAIVGIVGAIALGFMGPSMPPGEAQAGTFFGAGSMLLIAGLALVWAWLKRPNPSPVTGHGTMALVRLGSRNASRNPMRSILTAGLLASAAFLLVAVESFRRTPATDFAKKDGGSGGFAIVGEAELPLFLDLNSGDGRTELVDGITKVYQSQTSDVPVKTRVADAEAILDKTKIFPMRLKSGDDASCLNLYQAMRPRLLGVPDELITRGGFQFASLLTPTEQPWSLLNQTDLGENVVPVFVEQNTAMWMLKLGLGDDLEMPDESGHMMKLRIVGLLKDSVFQSEVLMSGSQFRAHFPRLEGYQYFLVETPSEDTKTVMNLLTMGLRLHGFSAETTYSKLAGFLEVQNSYLTTFQVLGGFGLLLGVLGLAVVLLRGVWERRAELALLTALGYRRTHLNQMVLAENSFLLVLGLGAGVIAALAAVLPHLAQGGSIPWARLSGMLTAVLVVGLLVTAVAVWTGVRGSLVTALRRE